MKNWHKVESDGEIVFICSERYATKKRIYPDGNSRKAEFFLLYDDQGKTVGYMLRYKKDDKHPSFSTYNSFGIVYNLKDKANPSFEVIYEDANVRFIAYEHSHGVNDYFLVGRWKSNEDKQDA